MKKACLIYNKFFKTPKLQEQYDMFVKAFASRGVELELRDNASFSFDLSQPTHTTEYDFGIMWDKDIPLATCLEKSGLRLFNSAKAVELCDDKALMHIAMHDMRVACPKTIIAPMTFTNIGFNNMDFVKRAGDVLGYPMIIKQARSSYGMGVYLAQDLFQAQNIVGSIKDRVIMQSYVSSSFGKDVRVFVVGGNAICAVQRENEMDFRSNVEQGGRMHSIDMTEQMATLACQAAQSVGADYVGVDLLFGENGMLVCELNTSAHFGTLYRVSGINMAEEIADYVCHQIYPNG